MLGFFSVSFAVCFISDIFSLSDLAEDFADGGLGNVVSKIMLKNVRQNSNDNKTIVP